MTTTPDDGFARLAAWVTPSSGGSGGSGGPRHLTPVPAGAGGTTAYGAAALADECDQLANTWQGDRNGQLNTSAFKIGGRIAQGEIGEQLAIEKLTEAARVASHNGKKPLTEAEIAKTIRSGITAGKMRPVPKGELTGPTGPAPAQQFRPTVTVTAGGTTVTVQPGAADDDPPTLEDRWPDQPHPDAFHGLPGMIVDNLDPYTEADRAAVLLTLLAAAGAAMDRHAHMFAGDSEHPARIWPLIIGRTAGGAKGTAWAAVARVLHHGLPWLLDPRSNFDSGMQSGEGLIERVRDGSDDPDDDDPGVQDKRLLIVESEFGSVLARAKKEGNSLGMVLRQAWDGTTLKSMARKNNKLSSTGHHIVVVGHITPRELNTMLTEGTDVAGGTMNRFLPVLSRRSKKLPDGGGAPDGLVQMLGTELAAACSAGRRTRRMGRTDEAAHWWRSELYDELTPDVGSDDMVAATIARAAPQVVRLSLIYALLDQSPDVDVPHLAAAMAVWRYVVASARAVFGGYTGMGHLDKLQAAIDTAGAEGLTKEQIRSDVFSRNLKKEEIGMLLGELLALRRPADNGPRYLERSRPPQGGRGRPSTLYARADLPADAPPPVVGGQTPLPDAGDEPPVSPFQQAARPSL